MTHFHQQVELQSALPKLGFGRAEDAVRLLHLRAAVTGIVHLQTVVELVQVFLHLLDLLPWHVLQPEANLEKTGTHSEKRIRIYINKNVEHDKMLYDNVCRATASNYPS